jgi:hypothetical protein
MLLIVEGTPIDDMKDNAGDVGEDADWDTSRLSCPQLIKNLELSNEEFENGLDN